MRDSGYIVLYLFLIFTAPVLAQRNDLTPLFQDEKPLDIQIAYSFKEISRNTIDSVYFPSTLKYKNGARWDSLEVEVRGRGNFRRKNCDFTPLRVKLKKSNVKGTLFQGNRALKLVLQCQAAKHFGDLILKEYLCYQLYECVTPYTFNTRLLDITIEDIGGKKSKTYQVKGFFIEDDNLVAKRFHANVFDSVALHPLQLQDTNSIRHDFFEYMIANTDWSTTYQHNAKVIKAGSKKFIPVAYDFDMSGFVNAPYATVSPDLEITSVQERLYRGFCRNVNVMQFVRQEFIGEKPAILATLDRHQSYFEPKEFTAMKKYILKFYDVLEEDKKFQDNILRSCRTK